MIWPLLDLLAGLGVGLVGVQVCNLGYGQHRQQHHQPRRPRLVHPGEHIRRLRQDIYDGTMGIDEIAIKDSPRT